MTELQTLQTGGTAAARVDVAHNIDFSALAGECMHPIRLARPCANHIRLQYSVSWKSLYAGLRRAEPTCTEGAANKQSLAALLRLPSLRQHTALEALQAAGFELAGVLPTPLRRLSVDAGTPSWQRAGQCGAQADPAAAIRGAPLELLTLQRPAVSEDGVPTPAEAIYILPLLRSLHLEGRNTPPLLTLACLGRLTSFGRTGCHMLCFPPQLRLVRCSMIDLCNVKFPAGCDIKLMVSGPAAAKRQAECAANCHIRFCSAGASDARLMARQVEGFGGGFLLC